MPIKGTTALFTVNLNSFYIKLRENKRIERGTPSIAIGIIM